MLGSGEGSPSEDRGLRQSNKFVRLRTATGFSNRSHGMLHRCLTVLCVLAGALVFASGSAFAESTHTFSKSFGSPGPGAGQVTLAEDSGVAVNDTTHDVYVADTGNARVDELDSAGTFIRAWGWGVADGITNALQTCTLTCFAGIPGSGAGQFTTPTFIAVDNSVGASQGDVYVADTGNGAVGKFSASGEYIGQLTEAEPGAHFGELDGVAVDPSGRVWVYQNDGGQGELDGFSNALANAFLEARTSRAQGNVEPGFAVDAEGDFYVVHRERRIVAKLNSAGEVLASGEEEEFGGAGRTAVAVDSGNNLYIDSGSTIEVFAAGGSSIESFGSEDLDGAAGLGVDAATDTVYAADVGDSRIDVFDSTPDLTTGLVTNQTGTSATVNGTVNPLGAPVTDCHFDYGTETSYGQTAACIPALGSGIGAVAVQADLSGLQAGVPYHFRLEATNAAGTTLGQDQVIAAPPVVTSTSAANVTSTSVDLRAQINSNFADTTYHFQYVDEATFQADLASGDGFQHAIKVPQPDIDIGAAGNEQPADTHVQGLVSGTIYHYRVVATNALGHVDGSEHTFTTQATGGESGLPDGRAWEMVSPPNKEGALIGPINSGGLVIQASEDGSAISYAGSAPIVPDPAGNSNDTQILSDRSADGWVSQDIATPHNAAVPVSVGEGQEYRFFSGNLSLGLVEPFGATPLAPNASERTPYLREADGTYTPLLTAANVPPGTKFGGEEESGGGFGNGTSFVGATPDLGHIVLRSVGVALTSTSAPEGGLYELTGGHLQLVSVLPKSEGDISAVSPGLGHGADLRHAISNDGSRIVWFEESGEGNLYMRDTDKGETVKLNTVESGVEGGEGQPKFQTASEDGSKVFFTDEQRLTVGSMAHSGSPDLYEFDVTGGDGPLAGKLTDLTAEVQSPGESADVQGLVMGASEDGSYVYFVATGELTSLVNAENEKAVPGGDNLYMRHGITTTFITTLSQEDKNDWGGESGGGESLLGLNEVTSRVSPHGRYLAFMSGKSLTGYDNIDVNSSPTEPHFDEEVFLYDANTDRLACVSCDPTGARPVGVFDVGRGLLVDESGVWGNTWLAGNIPTWTAVSLTVAFYQSRYLSDAGRLFFNSPDTLVPQGRNGKENVYEYEPAGVGDCQGSGHDESAGDVFSERAGGCIALISSGASNKESAFLDASASGDDVFFVTASRLVPQDYDNAYDVYDAHVCGASAPCSPSLASSPPCATADSCEAAPSPQPAIFGAPPSATFSGTGNLPASASKLAAKPKSLTRAQKLSRALKACKKKPKKKQAVCELDAKKKYETTKAKSKSKKSLFGSTRRQRG